uniref:Uncharacterized protein n=1 Tax=viral metagenome TaxID=1070528 RepID=A0A6C0LGR7_9ZZZZ
MNLKALYEYIKPLVDIYFYKYFGEKRDFVLNMIHLLDIKATPDNQETPDNCELINKIYYYVLLTVFLLLIIWILYDTFQKNYKTLAYKIGLLVKDQIRLRDVLEFKQIENIIYFTENFSLNIDLIMYLLFIVIILYIAYRFQYKLEIDDVYKEFNLLLPVLLVMLVLGIVYFIYNYTFLNLLSRRTHNLKDVIYKNINKEFINKNKICNYSEKKNKFDDYFQEGKCNDIKYNFNHNKLFIYISSVINEAYNTDNAITLEKFKTMKDKNGVLYKDKLSSAFYTFILIRYYVDNNLLDDAKDLFSTYNLGSYISRINPILSLNYDSLIFNSVNTLNYEMPKMKKAFNNNKDIYNYVYNDFYNNNSIIQELIVDIYNICKYKMISLYDYYLLNGIIILCVIIYYFFKYYFKK